MIFVLVANLILFSLRETFPTNSGKQTYILE